MDDDRAPLSDARDEPGAWAPDGDAPLVRGLTERSAFILLTGIGLIAAAVAIVRRLVLNPESVQVPMPVAVLLVTIIVLVLGGLGVGVVVTFARASRHTVRVGPDGLRVGRAGLRLAWDDVEAVALRVVRVRRTRFRLMPGEVRDLVLVSVVWRAAESAVRRAGSSRLSRRGLPDPFTHERLLHVPQFPGRDLPLADDVDAALRHFAGPRYRPVVRA